jgi:glycosyltransferase involved in cell wall biosynthesis
MRILFLDQTGQLGGAELCLIDIAQFYRDRALVGLFAEGPLRDLLEQHCIPVQVLNKRAIQVSKDSTLLQGISGFAQLLPLIANVAQKARQYELIYANTQKALVVGAMASFLSRRPLIYHLHDILSRDHFSRINLFSAVTLANRFASLVIANSEATQKAFIAAGGYPEKTAVVYNGFSLENYESQEESCRTLTRQKLGIDREFLVGHFGRLSPWKGQHILLEALSRCPDEVKAIFVGDALFGEQEYAESLSKKVEVLGLKARVQFLGFQSDIVSLMKACDLIAHTSTLPEPFGRVVVEAMLCGRPVIATGAGGIAELVEEGETGWLVSPGDFQQLAEAIVSIKNQPKKARLIAQQAQSQAEHRFKLKTINQQIFQLLSQVVKN